MRASEDPTPSSTEKREAYQQKLHMKEMTASNVVSLSVCI